MYVKLNTGNRADFPAINHVINILALSLLIELLMLTCFVSQFILLHMISLSTVAIFYTQTCTGVFGI